MQTVPEIPLLLYRLDSRGYALLLAAVEKVIRAVAVAPLLNGPETVSGFINMAGDILPVVSLRKRFALPNRPIDLQDRFIIAKTRHYRVVLWVDEVAGVISVPSPDLFPAPQIMEGDDRLNGLIRLKDDIVCIYDLDQFFDLSMAKTFNQTLNDNEPA